MLRTVIYCTNYSNLTQLRYNSALLSRVLYFSELGYKIVITGRAMTGKPSIINAGYADILLLDENSSPIKQLSNIRHLLDKTLDVQLVLARDLPSAKQALCFGKVCDCPVYYDSVETWCGYSVRNGKRLVYFYKNWISERMRIKKFTRVITHSRTSGRYLEKIYKLSPNRIGVLYAAQPRVSSSIPTTNMRAEVKNDYNSKLIVCSGGLFVNRGLPELIEMFKHVGWNYNLIFIGDGPLKPQLLNMVNKYNLQKRVYFIQFSTVSSYYGMLSTADIGIDLRPAIHLNYDLACSVRVVDYINCYLPVITSDTRGFRFIENEYGVVKCISNGMDSRRKAVQLERFIEEYLCDPEKTRKRIDNAMIKEFSFEVNLARLKNWLLQDGLSLKAHINGEPKNIINMSL